MPKSLSPPENYQSNEPTVTESKIIDAFHILEQSALAQAVAENLLTAEQLSGQEEADLQVIGPSLVIFFAALSADPQHPSVKLPTSPPSSLRQSTCPPNFQKLFKLFCLLTPSIANLPSAYKHDLVRLLVGLPPQESPVRQDVSRIAESMRAIAIEIGQRRTFLERYADDLQSALDRYAAARGDLPRQASFRPPPVYDQGRPAGPPNCPPPGHDARPDENDPVLNIIRETLYAALADVIQLNPGVLAHLGDDPARTYFACTALATLHFVQTCMTPDYRGLKVLGGPHGKPIVLSPADAPIVYRPLVENLLLIGRRTMGLYEEDDADAINSLRRDEEIEVDSRMTRLRLELEQGAEYQEASLDGRPLSAEGLVRQVANCINAFALRVCALPAFQQRATEVFTVLQALAGG